MKADGLLNANGTVVYIDADAHQGNGVCHTFENDSQVAIFDVFNERIYPVFDVQARQRIDHPIGVNFSWTGTTYVEAIREALPEFLDSKSQNGEISLAVYNAGTDVHRDDPLGGLQLSARSILERDEFIVNELRKRNIPTVIVLGGGYTETSYRLVADSLTAIVSKQPTASFMSTEESAREEIPS